jgi:crotonobetainyl-CoA:carnitine CoA-transferase CaiB-like acyl-CoA transferase
LCTRLGKEEYIPLQFDTSRREELKAEFRRVFGQKSLAQWEEELRDLDACWEKVHSLEETMQHPQFRARGMAVDFADHDGREVPSLGIPVQLAETPGSLRSRPAGFGEHTEKILLELGYSPAEVQGMREQGEV